MRTVLVTGATSGIGRRIARRFWDGGDAVVVCGRRTERLEALVEQLGERAHALAFDVADADAVQRAIGTLPDQFRVVDVLINNAGLAAGLAPAHEARLSDWDRMVAANCTGVATMTHAVLPGMVSRRRGLVVNIGSTAAAYAYPGANVYGATKAFVRQFSLNLRSDLRGTGVRVACVEPGMVGETEFSEVRFDGDQAKARAVYAGTVPLEPDDIASIVTWIASQPARVNINLVEVMPTAQSPAAPDVWRAVT